jgi:hypothetical protein
MGSILYEREKVFRQSIRETSELIREIASTDILPDFQGKGTTGFFEQYTSNMYIVHAIQMAFADLWKSRHIFPAATLGSSLGEASALYAAGGISRRDVVRWVTGLVLSLREYDTEFTLMVVKAGFRDPVFDKCAGLVYPFCEWNKTATLSLCHQQELDRADEFLRRHHISWERPGLKRLMVPVHTSLFELKAAHLEKYYQVIEPLPTTCDFYSCTLGRKVPAAATVPCSLFERMLVSPIFFHSTFRLALQDKVDAIVNPGNYAFKYEFEQEDGTGKAAVPAVFNSISLSRPDEAGYFEENHRALKKHLSRGWRRYFQ